MEPPSRSSKSKASKEVLDLASVLSHYGMEPPSGYGWVKFRCHGERKASAVANLEEGAVNCFSCGLKGDALSVIMQLDSCSFPDALVKYREITGGEAPGFGRERSNNSQASSGAAVSREYEDGSSWLVRRLRGK